MHGSPVSNIEDARVLHGHTGWLAEVAEGIPWLKLRPQNHGWFGCPLIPKLEHLNTRQGDSDDH